MTGSVGERMRWAVLWYVPKTDTIVRKDCEQDLNAAIRLYELAKKAGKDKPTLLCANFGFPPPEKWQPHYIYVKRKKKRVPVFKIPMEKANGVGIFWCPYCREFRRFQRQLSFYFDGRMVRDPERKGGLYCPMCGTSHRDFHVRRWNPTASRLYLSTSTTVRKPRASNRPRARSRRPRQRS